MKQSQFRELVRRLRTVKVLVLGDVILDEYVWGECSRISPEAPVPVVGVRKTTWVLGGAGNVAANLASLGVACELAGVVGADEAGRKVTALSAERGIDTGALAVNAGVDTIVKTRVVAHHQHVCRIDREGSKEAYQFATPHGVGMLRRSLERVQAVIFSDYAKGVVSEPLIRSVQEATDGRCVFLALDPKPRRQLAFRGLDLVTPNREEALELAHMKIGREVEFPAVEVGQAIRRQYAPKHLVVTMGDEGMLVYSSRGRPKAIPTVARDVFDVSGAGDTVIASLTAALASGVQLEQAAAFANLAAGIVVGKVGTATTTVEECESWLH